MKLLQPEVGEYLCSMGFVQEIPVISKVIEAELAEVKNPGLQRFIGTIGQKPKQLSLDERDLGLPHPIHVGTCFSFHTRSQ